MYQIAAFSRRWINAWLKLHNRKYQQSVKNAPFYRHVFYSKTLPSSVKSILKKHVDLSMRISKGKAKLTHQSVWTMDHFLFRIFISDFSSLLVYPKISYIRAKFVRPECMTRTFKTSLTTRRKKIGNKELKMPTHLELCIHETLGKTSQ